MKLTLLLASLHALFAVFSIWRARRSGVYRPSKLALQALLALAVPIVGPAWVLWMVAESRPETPKPTTNPWDRLEIPGDGH